MVAYDPPPTLTTRLGGDAGAGAAFLELPVATYVTGTGSVTDCSSDSFPPPQLGVLTTATVTVRRGSQSVRKHGAPFDCARWADGSGSAVIAMGFTGFEPLLKVDFAGMILIAE